MSRSVFLLILAAIPIGEAVFAQPAPILFVRQENRNDNIFRLTEQDGLRQITRHARKDSSPAVSPDGRTLVFPSERNGWWKIWSMDIETSTFRQLTDAGSAEYAPCWSPSGEEIAFVSTRDGNAEIYVMGKDGSGLRNVTQNEASDETPFWAADNRIYYSTEVAGTYQIASIRPDGADRRILTGGSGNKHMPQVSPDETTILYYGDADGNPEIYTMGVEGADVRRLTDNPLQDIRGRWSPDGGHIVFERGDKHRDQQIFVMDTSGEAVRQLTSDGYNYAPVFVADCSLLCAMEGVSVE